MLKQLKKKKINKYEENKRKMYAKISTAITSDNGDGDGATATRSNNNDKQQVLIAINVCNCILLS